MSKPFNSFISTKEHYFSPSITPISQKVGKFLIGYAYASATINTVLTAVAKIDIENAQSRSGTDEPNISFT